jgi:CubicO group peptidase (beta-lactamase class C family)
LRQEPLRPDSIFRLASVTKPFTAAAVRRLIADGRLSLSTRVFSLGVPGAGVLPYSPFGTPDARLADITVDHLLKHRGGWDRDLVGDLTYRERTIANAMGVTCPPGRENTVRYIMGQPLQYAPGSTYAYSNIGYLLLGLIVETISGQDYRTFVQANVIGLDGSTTEDWLLGRTFPSDQDLREPVYDDPVLASNVFYPAYSAAVTVERPYGSFDLEARTGQGRIVTRGLVLLRYLNRFQVAGDSIGGPRPAPGSWRWNHTGSQPGCNSLARQRGDGINYAVLFNKRPASGTDYASQIRTTLDSVFDNGGITTWPTADITHVAPPLPKTRLTRSPPELFCETAPGRHYQWQSSTDLRAWTDYLLPFVGTGSSVTVAPDLAGSAKFYRLVVRQ